ncbi:hypothetical protein PQR05_03945 [Paraburkholderia sediminicola]|uniref:hypothetical protein n=1 Tax=Paraburkholderia sediminicola TaxID=458836 RepID=UPI0038BC245D
MTELAEVLDRLTIVDSAVGLLADRSSPDDAIACQAMLDLLHQSEALLLKADLLVVGTADRDFFAPLLKKTFAASAVVARRLDRIRQAALVAEAATATKH